ncbi:MAG: cellulase family glycosylhydrolase [Armatimonadota bacterium]
MKPCLAILMLVLTISAVSAYKLPSSTIPDGLGVNIHFTGEPAQDLDMIQAAGFRFIRMDFAWGAIERVKGEYNFAEYDQLLDGLSKRNIRPIFILDYNNGLYEQTRGIQSEETRKAFANFAAAGAKRYAGRGVLWELWNEPNIGFWEPQPSLDAYMALAHLTIPMVKKADPSSIVIAPATSLIDLQFLEGCFKNGLLDMVDAISVHPYRQSHPETVEGEVRKLRALIVKYAPDHPDMPIISGEWGYSTAWFSFSDALQGKYLPRQFMINLSLGIPISIWYDWHDDGPDPKEPEHRFGTVTQDYTPKLSYKAMQALYKALNGMHFVKRLQSGSKDYIMLFSDGMKHTIAAWTIGDSHSVKLIPNKSVELTGDPQYFPIPKSARSLQAEASWRVETKSTAVLAGVSASHKSAPKFTVSIRNPFNHEIKVKLTEKSESGIEGSFKDNSSFQVAPGKIKSINWSGKATRYDIDNYKVTVKADIDGQTSSQEVHFNAVNPVKLDVTYLRDGSPAITVPVPEFGSVSGDLVLKSTAGKQLSQFNVSLSADTGAVSIKSLKAPQEIIKYTVESNKVLIPFTQEIEVANGIRVQLLSKNQIISDSGDIKLQKVIVDQDTVTTTADGNKDVPVTFKLYQTSKDSIFVDYEFFKGWKFIMVSQNNKMQLTGKPKSISVWVKGDGNSIGLRMRFTDSNMRTFQSDYGKTDFKDWRLLTARLDDPNVGNWGGTGSPDIIKYPIVIDNIMLIDGKQTPEKGTIEFSNFFVTY